MIITPTSIPGAFIIDLEPFKDERGFFARTVCIEEFSNQGLNAHFIQQSVSWNSHAGTLRGLHYQSPPNEEEKLVRVTQGAVFDVIVDIRRDSQMFGKWYGVKLSAENRRQLYIPKGVAHGFQTLVENSEVFYEMTVSFEPTSPRGIRWDTPELAIDWPDPGIVHRNGWISAQDMAHPSWSEFLNTV